jgi:hypothetical protein
MEFSILIADDWTLAQADKLLPLFGINSLPVLIDASLHSNIKYILCYRLLPYLDTFTIYFYSLLTTNSGLQWLILHYKNVNPSFKIIDCKNLPKDQMLLDTKIASFNMLPRLKWTKFRSSSELLSMQDWLTKIKNITNVLPIANPSIAHNGKLLQLLPISDYEAQWIHEPLFDMQLEFDVSIECSSHERFNELINYSQIEPLTLIEEDELIRYLKESPQLVENINDFDLLASNNTHFAYELIIITQNAFYDDSRYSYIF